MAPTLRLLYVDDEPTLLDIGKLFLEREGEFVVDTLTSAKEALLQLNIVRYDAIISDYQMPEMDGITFLKQLKASGNATPFIIFTGRGREEIVIEALNEGADFYLQKGGEPKSQFAELAHKIRQAVQQKRAEASIQNLERREADIINFLPDATLAIDTHGVVIAWNRAMEKMTGVASEKILGKGNYEYALPFYHERRPILIDLILKDDPVTAGKYPAITRDGTSLFSEITIPHFNNGRGAALWFTASPLYNTRGIIVGAIESIREITERKQVEEMLLKRTAFFEAQVESTLDGILVINERNERVLINQRLIDLWKIPAVILDDPNDEALLQYVVRQTKNPELFYKKVMDLYLHQEQTSRDIVEFSDGRTYDRYSAPVIDSTGRHHGRIWTFRDITERKQAEYAIRESEQKYRTVFETTGTATVLIENDGTISLANSEFVRLSGYPRDEIENKKKWMEFVVKEDLDRMLAQHRLRRTDQKRALTHYEFRYMSRSGDMRDIYLMIDVIPGTTKSVASLLDITERKRAVDNLITANREYTNLLSQIQDIYYRSDTEGNLIKASQSWATLLGYEDISECLGRSIADDFYFNPEDRKPFLEEVYRNGKVTDYEVQLRRNDGTPVLVSTSSHLYYDTAGKILGVEGTFRDITERKRQDHILKTQLDLGLALQSIRGLYETLETCLNGAIEISGMDAGGIYLVDGSDGSVDLIVSRNLGDEFLKSVSYYPDGSANARMVMAGKPVYVQFSNTGVVHTPIQEREGLKAIAIIPILSNSRVIACLNISSHTVDEIPANARVALETIATQIGAAIERIRADEALTESEERYRTLTEASNDLIFVIGRDDRVEYVNSFGAVTLNKSVDEIIGSRRISLFPSDVAGNQKKALEMVFEKGAPVRSEGIITLNDQIRWFDHFLMPLKDPDDQVRAVLGISRDITERKRAEEALLEGERRYRELVENLNDVVFTIDQNGLITYVSPVGERKYGYFSSDLLGKPFTDVVFGDDAPALLKRFDEISKGIVVPFEWRLMHKDGSLSWVRSSTRPVLDVQGTSGFLGIISDISKEKQVKAALLESEERLRTIINSMQSGIVIIDAQTHTILEANPKALDMIGGTSESVLGSVCHHFICPAESGRCPVTDIGQTVDSSERVLLTHRGEKISIIKSVIKTMLGGKEVLIESFIDITERKRAEERLSEINSAFLSFCPDPLDNITILTGLAGKMLQGTCALYNRLEGGMLCSLGMWNTPPDFASCDKPDGHICNDVIQNGDSSPVIIPNLLVSAYAETDPNVRRYQLKTYVGIPVKIGERFLGSLCVVYQEIYSPSPQDLEILSFLAKAVAIEDERRTAGQALRESEEKFRSLVEYALESILILDFQGKILFANNATARTIEAEGCAGIIGRNVMEFIDPESQQDVIRDFIQVAQGHDAYLAHYHVISAKGKKIYVESIGKVITFEGKPADLISIRDITEQKHAEDALLESERKLALVMDGVPALLAYVDADLRYVYVNKAYADWYGRTRQDIIGKQIRDLLDEEVFERALPQYEKVLSGNPVFFENRTVDEEKRERFVSVRLTPSYSGERVAGLFAVITDITERKRAEEVLRESEERFRKIFENSPIGMTLVKPDFRFFSVNPTWISMTGYSEEELQKMSFKDITHPDYLSGDMEHIRELVAGTIPVYSTEKRYIRKDGSILWGLLKLTTIRDQQGTVRYIGAQIEDITERKRAEDALYQANKKLNLLSGITRHDITNQLTVLVGYLEILEDMQLDPSQNKYFQKVATAAQRISSMIQFTKEYENIGVTAPAWQDIRTLVDTAAKEAPLEHIIAKNDIPAGTEVFADPLIVRVFYNLMDNAVRYGGKITTIRFFVQEHDGNQHIVCEDDGDGVPADEKERIFDRGFGKNTGLGLALSREILDIPGITIRETGEPGKGARFEITVPNDAYRNSPNAEGGHGSGT